MSHQDEGKTRDSTQMNCSFGHSLNHVINTTVVFMVLYVFLLCFSPRKAGCALASKTLIQNKQNI